MSETALIIGAGPAGLTAALEFVRSGKVRPIVLEASHEIGGISRTIRYKGNRMDIGGHRFFSKSDRVMEWWLELMPPALAEGGGPAFAIQYQNKQRDVKGPAIQLDPERDDLLMLVRPRKSRIYFLRRFFDYPIKLTPDTLGKLGVARTEKSVSAIWPRGQTSASRKSRWKILSSTVSARCSTGFFSSLTPRRCGEFILAISVRNGVLRELKVCRLPAL